LRVVAGDRVIFEQAYGWADLFSGRAMTADTIFDLASLTKPLAPTLAVMALVRSGRIDLDEPCEAVWPDLTGTDKARITMRQLLSHRSGLPAWRPFFLNLQSMPEVSRQAGLKYLVLSEPLHTPPGVRSDYSDLGFMLVQWLVEQVCGEPLDRFVDHEVYRPLGISDLFYNHVTGTVVEPVRYAATQLCPWRNRLLVGEVDDDNAWIVGGVAGQAGLFGTAEAVGQLLGALLAADQTNDGRGVFDPELVRHFLQSNPQERWALGFDTPSPQGSSAGRFFPAGSIGHLGFTGTSFWVHRSKRVMVVLLTNRVHPHRYHTGIKAFRPGLHDAVMEAVDEVHG
jgi:CubicO group peptidase (beta-lactamase class C family)